MSGCGKDHVSATLDRAEAIQDDYADSALAILDSLPIDDIGGDALKARYALLKTYVKANLHQLDAADSSLIDMAVDFYDKEKMADEAAKAYFYKADITYYADDYAEAMINALTSLEWNEKANNQRFKAKAYDLIADIYSHASNYPQAISYGRKAAYLFRDLDLKDNEFYSLLSVSKAYSQDDTTESKAVELLDSLKMNFKDVDSIALGYLHYRYIYPLYLLGRHHEGYEHYRKALSYWKGEDMLESKPLVADMFTNIGMYDSATYYLEQERLVNPDYENDDTYHFALRNLADSLGDIPLFYKEVMTFSELERENVRFAMRDEVSLIERDFERDRAERERLRKERNKWIFIFTVVVGFLLIVIMRQKHRLKVVELQKKEAATRQENEVLQKKEAATRKENMELKDKEAATRKENMELKDREATVRKENKELQDREAAVMKENRELQDREAAVLKENEELREQLQSGIKEAEELKRLLAVTDDMKVRRPLKALDAIYGDYFRMKDMDDSLGANRYGQLLNRFEEEIDSMRDPEYVAHLESVVDSRCDNILTYLRGLKKPPIERDIRMLTYILAGFSPRTVALLCNEKLGNYNLRYSRVKGNLKDSCPEAYDRLMRILKHTPSGRHST